MISPDGRTAAVVELVAGDIPTSSDAAGVTAQTAPGLAVSVVDLGTGESRLLSVPIDGPSGTVPMVFSPDRKWLFVTGPDGLFAVSVADRGTSQLDRDLDGALPPLQVLAVRPAP